MVDSWAAEYPAGTTQEFPVLLVNDLNEAWAGDVRFRLLLDGKILQEKTSSASVAGLGSGRIAFTVPIPEQPAAYQVEATLLATPAGPVHSLRDFSVLTPEQREARRNLAEGRPAMASSTRNASSRAEFAVDGKGETKWTPGDRGPQWLSVDLGHSQSVSRVVLAWGWGAVPKAYAVEVSSDGANWSPVYAMEEPPGPNLPIETLRFAAVAARWVRIRIASGDPASDHSLSELEVYH